MSASGSSFAAPSTITSALRLPATTSSRSLSGSCAGEGFSTKLPPMRATRTAEIGPRKGISESVSAAEAPTNAARSGVFSPSAESTVAMICVSSR
jgi:hypothetical protein